MVNGIYGMNHALVQTIKNTQRQIAALSTQPILLNASTGQDGGKGLTTDIDGLHVFNASGAEVARLETTDGALIMYDSTEAEIARYGLLAHTAAGTYGAEVLVGSTWVQLGAQTSTWATLSGIPSTYNATNQKWAPDAHTHPGGDITSRVAASTDAIGSNSGYNNTVSGTSFVAAWLGNDANFSFGRNTSSVQYKQNIREHRTDPADVLKLIPVLYDRIPEAPNQAPTNEYGLIAEQVHEHCPELVTWFDGKIDGIRYDLVAVALLDVVKQQDARLAALETAMAQLKPGYTAPAATPVTAHVPASAAPSPEPTPLPYTIQAQP
ncbi:hypothetical protein [Arthrobacter bambusae]|uniref:hypothetical protein n=1 Tax=Arthrobacter bambusae TaxID=1338426 RepID=UPI00278583F5|nr:hypothetical protein [Arthrobacter bambusae]MDQ0030170.1 hypothetical protein [Arthrobacter bambusae]MDQ0097852.1 hypothetical protein [Arthrobacter bambusae]